MKLEEIKQTTSQEEVNEYLAKGFQIIKVFSTKNAFGLNSNGVDVIQPTYVLALRKKEDG